MITASLERVDAALTPHSCEGAGRMDCAPDRLHGSLARFHSHAADRRVGVDVAALPGGPAVGADRRPGDGL